jgi:hypothetical protein
MQSQVIGSPSPLHSRSAYQDRSGYSESDQPGEDAEHRFRGEALLLPILPTSYLIDRRGLIVGDLTGAAKWDSPQARCFFDRFVNPPLEAR